MVGTEDAYYTYEYEKHFKILPQLNHWFEDPQRIKDGVRVADDFLYSSNTNTEWMSEDTLRAWLQTHAASLLSEAS